jgi:acetyl esterase/lipase
MEFFVRYLILVYNIVTVIGKIVLRWFIAGPKYGTWSLWLELEVAVITEAVRVFDSRPDFTWEEIRFMQDLTAKWCFPWEAVINPVNCNGVRGEFVTSKEIKGEPKATVFYLHGGGYCLGSCISYRKPIANLSKVTQSQFLVLEYARSPDTQHPFALEQVFEAYKWLLGQGVDPAKLVIAGDSAGGGLAAALLVALRDRGVPLPKCSILISPWTDLTPNSCMQNEKVWSNFNVTPYNPNNISVRFAKAYLGNATPKHPLVSPHYADLKGLPPMFLTSGGDEILLQDIERFHERCLEHEVKVTFDVGENMPHVYQILHQGGHKDIDAALDKIQRFIWDTVQ